MGLEHEWLRQLGAVIGPQSPHVLLGIGDDAACVDVGASDGQSLVCTVDACVEDVHFKLEWLTFDELGFRSLMAAASDLAAMGASGVAMLSAVTAPRGARSEELNALVQGQHRACERLQFPIVGGNVTRGPGWAVSTTVLGRVSTPLTRSGANVGDRVWVSGPVGHAGAGLAALLRGQVANSNAAVNSCVQSWKRPLAHIQRVLAVRDQLSAAIDVSDGLAQDLGHVAEKSKVNVILSAERVLSAGGQVLRDACASLSIGALTCALSGGEDYVVAACAPSNVVLPDWFYVGDVEAGDGLVFIESNGIREHAPPGFDHGA